MKWECLAVSLDELNAFVASIEKSRDPNEKVLKKRIIEDLLPLLEKQEEARKRKQAQKERELINLEKLATAKRSSRIAGKLEHQKQEEEAREAERKRQAELAMAKKEQEKWMKLEKERESRMMTREQRLKEREARRILHEEELANLSEDSKKLESGGAGRLSERHLKAEIEKKKQALEELAEEEDWMFDCICGTHGQIDDGTHSIACDKCNIWQHSKCVGVSEAEADQEDFHFICKTCERRAKDAERAKTHPPIKIKLSRPGSSSSPMPPNQNGSPGLSNTGIPNGSPRLHSSPKKAQQSSPPVAVRPIPFNQSNGHQLSPWQSNIPQSNTKPVVLVPPMGSQNGVQHMTPRVVPSPYSAAVPSSRPQDESPAVGTGNSRPYVQPYGSPYGNPPPLQQQNISRPSSSHAFSPPHPYSPTNLPPPGQKQTYSFVNGNAQQYAQNASHGTSAQHNVAQPSQIQPSPTPSGANGYGLPPSRPVNGQQPQSHDGSYRRSSINMPSPLSGAPILTPVQKAPPMATFSTSSSPLIASTPSAQPSVPQPAKSSPTPITRSPQHPQIQDPNQATTLPPASTGISPTKHSPPRPTTSNGSFGSATPSVLPPVASLSPSPRLQNLTPPIKPSEPNRPREISQSVSLTPAPAPAPAPAPPPSN